MTMAVKAVPEGWHTVTPRLFAKDPVKLVDFLKHAFGASGTFREDGPTEVRIGDSIVMVSGTDFREATEAFLYLYLEDTDTAYRRALEAGATSLEAPQDMFYGDRRAMVKDPSGNVWQIATHQEDLSVQEIRKRAASLSKG
jgi:PhnB protein